MNENDLKRVVETMAKALVMARESWAKSGMPLVCTEEYGTTMAILATKIFEEITYFEISDKICDDGQALKPQPLTEEYDPDAPKTGC